MTEAYPTNKFKKILLPTDGSEFSEGATREAISLAKMSSGKLIAISVIETNPEYETIAPQLVEKAELETRELLDSIKALASKDGIDCETIARHSDDPYRSIVDEAKKQQPDTIVMGRRGRKGLKRLLMGSVTAKVIGHSPCDVLVMPKAAKITFKNILIATDNSRFGALAATEAIAIAKQCGSNLIIISVVPSEELVHIEHSRLQLHTQAEEAFIKIEMNVKALREAAAKEGVSATGLVVSGSPAETIINTAKEKNVDLIIVGSHGRTGIDRLLMGSVTERVILLSECAVLVVKMKEETK